MSTHQGLQLNEVLLHIYMFIIYNTQENSVSKCINNNNYFIIERTLWPSWYRRSMVPPFYKNQ